uniref:hypothetical protein n=1 Tax=Lentilactobacillus hilgardii TaxID=1588 RepID=UPI00403F46CD
MKKGSLLVVGIFFLSFGLGSAISNKASATVSPAFYHPNLLGYTVPRALRGTWYFGHKKYPGGAHHFNGLHYHRAINGARRLKIAALVVSNLKPTEIANKYPK